MIRFEHVTKKYDDNIGLDDVSIKIDQGDFVFLVGPSGAGKSTFVKLILKEIDADSGSIKVKGREVTTMSNRMVPKHRRNIGIVFQDFRLLPNKTVFENVAFAMEITHHSRKNIQKKVPQALSLMGISAYADKYPDELSAGEQQRVAIARAIVNRPTVLIADEPTGNLDPVTAWEIMKLLDQINKRGTTILMVTHAKDIVDRMHRRVLVIEDGKIVRDEYGAYGLNRREITEEEEELLEAVPEEVIDEEEALEEAMEGEPEAENDGEEYEASEEEVEEALEEAAEETVREKAEREALNDDEVWDSTPVFGAVKKGDTLDMGRLSKKDKAALKRVERLMKTDD